VSEETRGETGRNVVLTPVVTRDASGHCTIDWGTADGRMPVGGIVSMSVELVAAYVDVVNELADARDAICALVERVQRGGPSNVLDWLDRYMSPAAADVVRAATSNGGS
jgi:hypothetical protein